MFDINLAKAEFDASVTHYQAEITSLRTGRATPSLVENILVEAYGSKMPLVQVASISVPEPRTIVIQPWDRGTLKDIEKAIQASNLSVQPIVDQDIVRLNFPSLTEENRKDLVKVLHQKAEASRVTIKQKREKLRDTISQQEKSGDLTEDEKFKAMENLDALVKQYHDKIKEISDKKETEIMTI